MLIIETEELTVRMSDSRLGVGPADAAVGASRIAFLEELFLYFQRLMEFTREQADCKKYRHPGGPPLAGRPGEAKRAQGFSPRFRRNSMSSRQGTRSAMLSTT